MKLPLFSTVGQNATMTVSDAIFGVTPNMALIAQAVRVYLMNQRQGTSKVKTRGEINRTKKKWFRQKGTGNARHGARTPNIFVGGGVAHGPTGEQNWLRTMPVTMKRQALISVLSSQAKAMIVSDDLQQLDGKTSSAEKMILKMLPDAERVLVVLADYPEMVMRSLRNLPFVFVTRATTLTTYHIAAADGIIFTKAAIAQLEERLTPSVEKTVKAPKVAKAEKVEKVAAPKVVKTEKVAKKAAAPKAAPKAAVKSKVAKPAKKSTVGAKEK
jgi:large subunit ribosomal protein L4